MKLGDAMLDGMGGVRGAEIPVAGVLIVDDEPTVLRALRRMLEVDGHRIRVATGPNGLEEGLRDPDLAVVLLDLQIGAHDGLDLLANIRSERPDLEVVVMTGCASVESAVACMRLGASDYLSKPFGDLLRLRQAVRQAVTRQRERADRGGAVQPDDDLDPQLVSEHPRMRALVRTIASQRQTTGRILIVGENGTGKELVARAIHGAGGRGRGCFVQVDCASLLDDRVEVEFLGRVATGDGQREIPGAFERAKGGTLFLDAIEELPRTSQPVLVRAFQRRPQRSVEGCESESGDLRVIASSRCDIRERVGDGRFNPDLFYRLDGIVLEIPPLRERREDVPRLARHFFEIHRSQRSSVEGFAPDALEILSEWSWPGNVRELENVVESALALAPGPLLRACDLRLLPAPGPRRAGSSSIDRTIPLSLDAYERHALRRALSEADGDAGGAARRLGIGRSTFYRKLAKHDLRAGSSEGGTSERPSNGWVSGSGVGGVDSIG